MLLNLLLSDIASSEGWVYLSEPGNWVFISGKAGVIYLGMTPVFSNINIEFLDSVKYISSTCTALVHLSSHFGKRCSLLLYLFSSSNNSFHFVFGGLK